MTARLHFSADDARRVGAEIGIDYYTRLERMEEQAKPEHGAPSPGRPRTARRGSTWRRSTR
jgi:hypothetical protein